MKDFYTNQRSTWEKLQKAMEGFKPNRQELEKDADAAQALARMDEIISAGRPYGMIKEVEDLLERARKVNEASWRSVKPIPSRPWTTRSERSWKSSINTRQIPT